eukprot:TRINITY_DN16992_c0_g1_i1.p1 TRINITY_DN16992_c0_g1~~TRINITY_DN16992_c0_g1_i1.p1  ORF type:complete len:312 (+),score=111.89 TRINITY_DN16992_c0_g1_i1:51-938(+)
MSDAVNVLTHAWEVPCPPERFAAVEKLKKLKMTKRKKEMQKKQDEKVGLEKDKEKGAAEVAGASAGGGGEGGDSGPGQAGGGTSVSVPVEGRLRGGALWDIFRREDVPKLRAFLRTHQTDFMHFNLQPVQTVSHEVHDQVFFLSERHISALKEEYGVEPWTFVQYQGEAVFIPAGCPHQVRNLKSCMKVAMDFVSMENVEECEKLAMEFRLLPSDHRAKEDKLEAKRMVLDAAEKAVELLLHKKEATDEGEDRDPEETKGGEESSPTRTAIPLQKKKMRSMRRKPGPKQGQKYSK